MSSVLGPYHPVGFPPERTLVLETIGSIEKFYRAAARIPGLDFVEDHLGENLDADDDFFQEKDGEKSESKLSSFVYLTITNRQALQNILGYWKKYTRDQNYKFPHGLGPLKELFKSLYSIRYWDTEDRVRETGILDDWRLRLSDGAEIVPVEIELWYRSDIRSRDAAEQRVRRLVNAAQGQVVSKSLIVDIHYHALLVSLPISSIKKVINEGNQYIDLLRCDEVMYFRPSGRCMTPTILDQSTELKEESVKVQNDEINAIPIVALLDGLPLENHEWLANHLIVDDPDSWSSDYAPYQQVHGTSMASLLVRGNPDIDTEVLSRKIYCRPITKPYLASNGSVELIPDDTLPLDIIHRAVVRMFDGDGDEPPSAPSIKIINLSVADPNRRFDRSMSPWAKLIDYFSYKYNVLFVISAGNQTQELSLNLKNSEFNTLPNEEKEKTILKAISNSIHERRLMSPAEAINAITVGAYHNDGVPEEEFYNLINPYRNRTLPSPLNPVTWGKKRSVKPEILMPGGRATYKLGSMLDKDPAVLKIVSYSGPPGQKVASPGSKGALNAFAHTFGTSNAAALASRRLQFLNDTINDLYSSSHGSSLSPEFEHVLMKALLCHGSSFTGSYSLLESILKTPVNSRIFKAIASKYLGYGIVDENRIHGCTENQATIIQTGRMQQNEQHSYKFILPQSLNAHVTKRRLIITLAWLTPVNPSSQEYRQSHLFFEPITGNKPNNYLYLDSRESDHTMVRNGTVQHEVLSGDKATAYADGTTLDISINCKIKVRGKDIFIPYGLVVTLDTPDINLPIYEEVKTGINSLFEIENRAINIT